MNIKKKNRNLTEGNYAKNSRGVQKIRGILQVHENLQV